MTTLKDVITSLADLQEQFNRLSKKERSHSNKLDNGISEAKVMTEEVKREAESNVSDAWNSAKFYYTDDFCIWNNALWLCKFDNMGSEPAEGSLYWEKKNIVSELIRLNNLIKEKEK